MTSEILELVLALITGRVRCRHPLKPDLCRSRRRDRRNEWLPADATGEAWTIVGEQDPHPVRFPSAGVKLPAGAWTDGQLCGLGELGHGAFTLRRLNLPADDATGE